MIQEHLGKATNVIQNEIKREFIKFIQTFEEGEQRIYQRQAENMLNTAKHIMLVSFRNFITYNNGLALVVYHDYYKYEHILNEALTNFMHEFQKNFIISEENKKEQDITQRYVVAFDDGMMQQSQDSVRNLKCQHLGKLRAFRGTVTRTSEVKPELIRGVFKCKQCGHLSKPIDQQFRYTEPKKCLTNNCDSHSWQLQISKSIFSDFQKLRIQQDPTKIPPGAMPRSIDVILRDENTQKGQPGDLCKLIGYLCVLPQISSMIKPGERTQFTTRSYQTRGNIVDMEGVTGIKGIRELNYKLIFIAINIQIENNQFTDEIENQQEEDNDNIHIKENYTPQRVLEKIFNKLTQQQLNDIKAIKENPRNYQDLADSLFPTIFGHSQVKKALLLQLFSGIHKKTKNKINIRGDINILLVGDPSTAKSQFLKCINRFVPRSVYTNGKTTSAAGLTASVTRDDSGNVGIEAGALMLADNGICCIDQFDKMQIKDQVAIHEAMQQQTISIAKAGVFATLNARTSVLAAANPLYGRYDKTKALKFNIEISAPIMSRFDLFFVICDEANDLADQHLSKYILEMHKKPDQTIKAKYDPKTIKKYISLAKKIKPRITIEAANLLREYYIEIRSRDKSNQNTSHRITVRQLESMIRLSQAYARLLISTQITQKHVKQAYRLLNCSILKLQKPPIELQNVDLLQQKIKDKDNTNRLMEQQIQRRRDEKKSKKLTISHDLYQEIQKHIVDFYLEKQIRHQRSEIDQENKINQDQLCTYLLTYYTESGTIHTIEESDQMKKIINATIRKLIKDDRVLIILQDTTVASQRILGLHPNFIE